MKTLLVVVSLIGLTLVIAGPAFGQRPPRRTTLQGHAEAVRTVTFSPDGRMLASASDDGTIKLWEVITGKLRATLQGESQHNNSLAFSADGKLLGRGGPHETISRWNLTSGQQTFKLDGHTGNVTSVVFSKNGALIALAGSDNTLKVWDVKTGQEKARFQSSDPVSSVAFSNEGNLLVSASWSRPSGSMHIEFANRTLALYGPIYGTVNLWDVPTGKVKATAHVESTTPNLSITPDARLLAASSIDGTIGLYDVVSGKEKQSLKAQSLRVLSFALSSDGALLASGGLDLSSGRLLDTIKLWDLKNREERLTLYGHNSDVFCVAFSPDCSLLASGDGEGKIIVWQLPATNKAR
jgi:WD40 repeat protein